MHQKLRTPTHIGHSGIANSCNRARLFVYFCFFYRETELTQEVGFFIRRK